MSSEDKALSVKPNFVGGSNVAARGAATLVKYAPATGRPLYRISESSAADIAEAAASAQEKFAWWSARTPAERSAVLLSLANVIESRSSDFIYLLSAEQGIPAALAREHELPTGLQSLRYWATRILHDEGGARPIASGGLSFTRRRPIGAAGILGSSTRPFSSLLELISAALAVGNTVVAKPSARAPGPGLLLASLSNEAGIPPGALNFVFGSREGAGRALVDCAALSLIAFAGSQANAALLRQKTAARGRRFYVQAGGAHATIITAEADISEAALASVRGAFSPLNEPGLDAQEFFVHASVEDSFAEKITRTIDLLRVGDPEDRNTQIGPLLTKEAREKFLSEQRAAGPGEASTLQLDRELAGGYFVGPRLIRGPGRDEEPGFGPVLRLETYLNEKDLLGRLSRRRYHSGSVWSRSLGAVHSLCARLPFGTVCVNAWALPDPNHLGGGAKRGGTDPADPLEAFTDLQTIRIKF